MASFAEKPLVLKLAFGSVALATALLGVSLFFGQFWSFARLGIAQKALLAVMYFVLVLTVLGFIWRSVRLLPYRVPVIVDIGTTTDTEGIDFRHFNLSVNQSVKRKCYERMPPSIKKGVEGRVSVQFRIQQDGKLPDGFMKVLLSSGVKEIDEASLTAIHDAAPFDHLPSGFSQPFVELLMEFLYNLEVFRR
ncbi:MAG: energy transducer TonB [Candidatus Acidiferrum sp.]